MKRARISSAPPVDAKKPFRGTERFNLLRRLGEGGYGAVYEAYDRARDQRVALKVLTRIGPEHVMRFKQEFRALQDLQHPNLVQLGEMFEDEGRWFFTMELVQGADWLEYVRGGHRPVQPANDGKAPLPFDPLRLRSALIQLVEGVHALHRGGKVHRDIKPSNIQVTEEGRVVLLDFGLVTNAEARQTTEALAVGTAAYMAPEQATGVPVGPAADWYGVGVVLYEAITGRLPFAGSAFEMLLSKQSSEPAPPRVLMPEVPAELSALCVGLLKPDPAARLTGEEVLRHAQGGRASDGGESVMTRHSGTALTRGAPFVGREDEQRLLSEVFARVGGERRMAAIYVHGESGVGKSALVSEFTEEIEGDRSRIVVLRGRCYERETVPYKAFDGVVDALTRFLRTLSDGDCAALLPRRAQVLPMVFPVLGRIKAITMQGGQRFTDVDRATLRTNALSALRELFDRLSRRFQLVVHIDDLQWADAESLALLMELSRPPEPPPFMLIVTARDPEECPLEVQNAFEALLEQAPIAERIRIAGLPMRDAERLATALLESGESSVTVDAAQVAREAEGHPLFIDALVRYSQQVRLTDGARPELDDALRFRIAQLDPDARRLLELCALAAAPLPHKVVADAAGWPLARASSTIAKLRVLKLVRTSRTRQTDTVETFHDRMRHATVTRLLPGERRKLHRQLAEAIEATDLVDVEAAAFHFREANARDKAAVFALRAADRAMENLAFDKAARLYREVVELDPQRRAEVSVKLADALSNAGRGHEAADVYMAALEWAPPEQKSELLRRAAHQLLGSGNIDAGMNVARELLAALGVSIPETLRGTRASLLWNRTKLGLRGLGFRERDTTEVSEEELSRVDTLWAMAALGTVDHFRGADLQARHLAWSLDTGEPYRVSRAFSIEGWLAATSGKARSERTERVTSRAMELAQKCGRPHAVALAHLAAGVSAYCRGSLRLARAECEASEGILRDRCTGVAWETTNARLFGLMATMAMGDFRTLKRKANMALRESLERGDRYAYTNLTTSIGYMATILEDSLDEATASVEEAVLAWTQKGFYLQHGLAFVARTALALVGEDRTQARRIVEETWPELERSELLRTQPLALECRWVRARTYAAAAAQGGPDARQLLAVASDDARHIARMQSLLAPGIALAVRAAVARAQGDQPQALALLEQAHAALTEHEFLLGAVALKHARGALIGGDEGQRLRGEAAGATRELGMPSPELIARVYWPM